METNKLSNNKQEDHNEKCINSPPSFDSPIDDVHVNLSTSLPFTETANKNDSNISDDENNSECSHLSEISCFNDVMGKIENSGNKSDLSCGEADSENESSEEDKSVELLYSTAVEYPEIDLLEEEEGESIGHMQKVELTTDKIVRDFRTYWAMVKRLKAERKEFTKVLARQLKKSRKFSLEQVRQINASAKVIEDTLNSVIPIVGSIKAIYEKDSDKTRIIKRGFIYKKVVNPRRPNIKKYECIFNDGIPCRGFIYIDDFNCFTDRSFIHHCHPTAEFDPKDNDPIPVAKLISLPRVKTDGEKNGKFMQILKIISDLDEQIFKWRREIQLCYDYMIIFKDLIAKLKSFGNVGLHSRVIFTVQATLDEFEYLLERVRLEIPSGNAL